MVNEKCRENIAAWDIFDEKRFPGLFARILALQVSRGSVRMHAFAYADCSIRNRSLFR